MKPPPMKLLLQLKLPGYSGRAAPGRFESWLADIVNLNKKERSLLTEMNIKTAWTETMRNLHLDNRVEEMNSKAGKSAMFDIVSKAQIKEQKHANAIKNSRSRWLPPSVLKDLDVRGYKIPTLGPKHLEAVRYSHFAKQVQQANIGKPFNQEVVEACFWRLVDDLLKRVSRGSSTNLPTIMKEGRSVMTQAEAYWTNVESQSTDSAEVNAKPVRSMM